MGINLVAPTGLSTAVLIADSVSTTGGSNDSIATLTESGGNPVSAALELQSTKGGLLLPRMTTAQRDLLNVVNGMQIFNSTTGGLDIYQGGGWVGNGVVVSPVVSLTQAQVIGMFSNATGGSVQIVPAPGANKAIIVHRWAINTIFNTTAFNGGGIVNLQYGALAADYSAANAAAASMAAAVVTAGANNVASASAASALTFPTATIQNSAISLSNATAVFGAGNANSRLDVRVWYSIISVV